jgi:hypothetical protein
MDLLVVLPGVGHHIVKAGEVRLNRAKVPCKKGFPYFEPTALRVGWEQNYIYNWQQAGLYNANLIAVGGL